MRSQDGREEAETLADQEKFADIASGRFNWELERVWDHNEKESYSIYMFRQNDTDKVQWFVVRGPGKPELDFYHFPIVLKFQSKVHEETNDALRTKLEESEKEKKCDIGSMAIGFAVGLVVTAIVARVLVHCKKKNKSLKLGKKRLKNVKRKGTEIAITL